ncbi:MAG: M20/M25/M40 family metallo-hydrolase [Anaerolineae bacterium]|nr:M20/M25/M40 family metallo-hydrolase [Anaerolineae bacterium]
MTTQRILLTTRGRAAHAGLAPEAGISAILAMADVLEAIPRLDRADRPIRFEAMQGGMRVNVIAPECRTWLTVDADAAAAEALCVALNAVPMTTSGATVSATLAADPPRPCRSATGDASSGNEPLPQTAAKRRRYRSAAPAVARGTAPDVVDLTHVAARLAAWMKDQASAMQALLEELAALETPSLQPETQSGAFDLLARELLREGYTSTWWPGRRSGGLLLACPVDRQRGAPVQLLLGHCDTVWPVGTLAEMPLRLEDGRLSGPGVFDMKGGLVQTVFALRALRSLGITPPATPVMLVNSDEEIGSDESTLAIERLARISCRAFVMEPALGVAGKLKTARKGVGQFRMKLSGDRSDANIVAGELARLIRTLSALTDPVSGASVNVGIVCSGAENETMDVELIVDVRAPDAGSARQIEQAVAAVRSALPSVTLETAGGISRPPMERTQRNQALWRSARTLGENLGLALEEGAAGGGSDGNTTSQFTATLDGLGAVGDGAHALHEHILIDEMPQRAALLALLLLSPLK